MIDGVTLSEWTPFCNRHKVLGLVSDDEPHQNIRSAANEANASQSHIITEKRISHLLLSIRAKAVLGLSRSKIARRI